MRLPYNKVKSLSQSKRLSFFDDDNRAQAEPEENRLKAERARFLDRRERRAKPETEQALACWAKACVFSNALPEPKQHQGSVTEFGMIPVNHSDPLHSES
jgi:hypothetical protein